MRQLSIQAFPVQTYDKIRYGDTDRQGHAGSGCELVNLPRLLLGIWLTHPDASVWTQTWSVRPNFL